MPRGFPDSWVLWGTRKVLRGATRGLRGSSGSGRRVSHTIFEKSTTSITYSFGGLKIYDEKLRLYLNTNSGDLWKWLELRGNIAVAGAKAQVGVRTGALRNSIHKRHLGNATGQYLWIGSNLPYAYLHHEGTLPHIIKPSPGRATKPLVFRKGTVIVHTSIVRHPGTKPNPYLRNQLRHFL
jgi:hypothetical protein